MEYIIMIAFVAIAVAAGFVLSRLIRDERTFNDNVDAWYYDHDERKDDR